MSSCIKDNSDIVAKIALALYCSKSMKFGSFRIKSGVLSPYYIDLTWLLSSPRDFRCVVNAVAKKIREIMAFDNVDKLASIELKGALVLPSIASKLDISSVVVRKARKQYGLIGRIAGGNVTEGERILFFDDVISDGISKLKGIKALEEVGAEVKHVMVLVDREQGGKNNIEVAGYKFHALTRTTALVKHLLQFRQISEEQAKAVLDYVKESKDNRI